jgi:hypothetical protein
MTEPVFGRGTEIHPGTERDTWRDLDADSGIQLDSWLGESSDRNLRAQRWNDPILGTVWTVDLVEGMMRVASGRSRHLNEAWESALSELRRAP